MPVQLDSQATDLVSDDMSIGKIIADNAIFSGISLILMGTAFAALAIKPNVGGAIGALIGPYIPDLAGKFWRKNG